MRYASLIVLGIAFALLAILPSARAQPIAYGHTIGDSLWQNGYAINTDAAGNVYVLGQTAVGNGSDSNLLIAKFDPTGIGLWQRQLNFSAMVSPTDLVTDAGGNVYVDAVATLGNGSQYGVLVALSAAGSLGFAERFPMLPNGLAWNAATSSIIVTGDGVWGYGNGFVASFSSSGVLQWMRSASIEASASAWGASTSSGGEIYVAVDRPTAAEASIAEFAGNGSVVAQRRLDQLGSSAYTWDTGVSPNGTAFFLGYDTGIGLPIVAGFNSTLVPLWSEFSNVSWQSQDLERLAVRSDGSFYAIGSYFNYSSYKQGSVILQVAGNGTLVGDDTYDSYEPSGNFLFRDAAIQTDGSVLIVGTSVGAPARDERVEGYAGLWPTPGSWVSDNVTWMANTTTTSGLAVTLLDPGFALDDFSLGASAQVWWGALGTPPPTLNVTVAADVPPPSSFNRTVNFSSSVSGGSAPYGYRWSFGDGTFSNAASPVHTYAEGGFYPVQLWVNDSRNARGYNFTQISLFGPPVITSFSASPNVTYTNSWVYFYASVTDPSGGYITNYHWDFGDNSSADTSYNSVYHVYYSPGTYTATLRVSSSEGLNASATTTVRVIDQPPYACLQMYPDPALVGFNVSYYSCSWDPDGYIASWSWNFGDGSTRSGPNASSGVHVYTAPGTYQVTLNVTDNSGSWAVTSQTEYVYVNTPPVARFTMSVAGNSNASGVPAPYQLVVYDGSASYARNPGANIQEWMWDFGDGNSTQQYYYPYAYHMYSVGGRTYHVSLTVLDTYGAANTTTHSLYVDLPPVAKITAPRSYAKVGTPFVVNGTASTDADGSIRRWLWDFGDGGTATGAVTSHVYASTGSFTITLVVFDNNNLTATSHMSVSVVEPKSPTAILSYAPDRPFAGAAVAFNAAGSSDPDGAIVSYTWEFGDGVVGSGAIASHSYPAPGTYTVVLTVLDEDSLTSSSTTTIQVISRPVAAFAVFPTNPASGDAVSFSAQGSSDLSGVLTYTWSFGDGSYGTGWQVSHVYAQPGSYEVVLTVTNAYGVNATATQTVVVAPAGLGTSAVAIGWLGLGLAVGAGAVALALYLLDRRRKHGGGTPPAP